MKEILAKLACLILGVSLLIGGVFLSNWIGLTSYKIFGTQWESARTDVYRENKSYVEGTVRDLRTLQVEYESATDKHRSALKSLILHRARELDWNRLPSDLKRFLEELEKKREN